MKKENFLRRGRAVKLARLLEKRNREQIVRLRKQVLCLGGEMIEKLGPSDAAMPAERPKISVAFQIQAMLLDAHVTHSKTMRHFSDGQALASLEQIHNRKPLAAANLGDETLHDGQPILLAVRFRFGEVF